MIVETKKRSSQKTYGRKFKDLLRENIKMLGENVKMLRESVKMFYNMKKTRLCVSVKPKCRASFQFSKFIHGALVFSLVFMVSPGSVWALSNDFVDFSVLALYWRAIDCNLLINSDCGGMDFEPDGDVDEADLADFSRQWVEPNIITLYSIGAQDGRIGDDGTGAAFSGVNFDDNDANAIRLGDLGSDWSGLGYRSILAFNMALLPSDAEILSARLELNRGGSVGENPFDGWGGNCMVDVDSPRFGPSSTLQVADWSAPADVCSVATLSEIDANIVESTYFSNAGLNALDITSDAQIRIYFETITNAANDPNYDYLGFYSGEYTADPNLRPRLIVEYVRTGVFIIKLNSIAADDGRVSAQDFNAPPLVGSEFNNTDTTSSALRLGDYEDNLGPSGTARLFSQRTVVSFNTSMLPNDCTIVSAKLQMTISATDGNDPFIWGGNCYIDANSPSIGDTNNLEASDWEAVSDANQVAKFDYLAAPADDSLMISTDFNAAGRNAISKTAKTQLKVYFSAPYLLKNGVPDALKFYSGEWADETKKPKLIIQYEINTP